VEIRELIKLAIFLDVKRLLDPRRAGSRRSWLQTRFLASAQWRSSDLRRAGKMLRKEVRGQELGAILRTSRGRLQQKSSAIFKQGHKA
jgi:hypothetical protein